MASVAWKKMKGEIFTPLEPDELFLFWMTIGTGVCWAEDEQVACKHCRCVVMEQDSLAHVCGDGSRSGGGALCRQMP